MTTSKYNRLSVAEKEARNRLHGRPRRCPVCEMGVQPGDILAHASRCEGPPALHPQDRWVGWSEARRLGAGASTLHRWVAAGRVRISGEEGSRRYLLGDLEICLLTIRLHSRDGSADKTDRKTLTKRARKDPRLRMGTPIETELSERLAAFVESVGGFAAAGRKLDIPSDTLRRAAAGEKVRRGTKVLIDRQIADVMAR